MRRVGTPHTATTPRTILVWKQASVGNILYKLESAGQPPVKSFLELLGLKAWTCLYQRISKACISTSTMTNYMRVHISCDVDAHYMWATRMSFGGAAHAATVRA